MTQILEYQVPKIDAINTMWRLIIRKGFFALNIVWLILGIFALLFLPGGFWGALIVAVTILNPTVKWLTIRSVVNQHPEILEVQRFFFDDEGIHISNSLNDINLRWDRIKGLINSKDYYLIRYDTFGSGVVLPKNIFSEDKRNEFHEYLNTAGSLKST